MHVFKGQLLTLNHWLLIYLGNSQNHGQAKLNILGTLQAQVFVLFCGRIVIAVHAFKCSPFLNSTVNTMS